MIIFEADHPLVLDGTYDREGYTPNERRAQQRRLQNEATMAKKRASKMDKKLTKPDTRKVRVKGPRQPDLIEDREIKPLENIAVDYAEIRDRRMELTEEEAVLKKKALALMHKFGKTEYRRGDVLIKVVEGEETIKVRIGKPGGEEPEDEPEEPEPARKRERTPEDEPEVGEAESDTPEEEPDTPEPSEAVRG